MNIQNAEWKLELEWDDLYPVYVTKVGNYFLEIKVIKANEYYFTSPFVSQVILANSLTNAIERAKIIWTKAIQSLINDLMSTI